MMMIMITIIIISSFVIQHNNFLINFDSNHHQRHTLVSWACCCAMPSHLWFKKRKRIIFFTAHSIHSFRKIIIIENRIRKLNKKTKKLTKNVDQRCKYTRSSSCLSICWTISFGKNIGQRTNRQVFFCFPSFCYRSLFCLSWWWSFFSSFQFFISNLILLKLRMVGLVVWLFWN